MPPSPALAALPLAATLLGLAAAGCVEPLCTADADCGGVLVCEESSGECVEPECWTHDQCEQGRICDDNACVPGCVDDDDCDDDEICDQNHCVPESDVCEGVDALPFCAPDINPWSPTQGQDFCVATEAGAHGALFFGSMSCGSCRGIFTQVHLIGEVLESEGLAPALAFVQVSTAPIDSGDVEEDLDESVDDAVVLDTDELGLWDGYRAERYELVLVDGRGCVVAHYPPLTYTDLQEGLGDEIEDEWRAILE